MPAQTPKKRYIGIGIASFQSGNATAHAQAVAAATTNPATHRCFIRGRHVPTTTPKTAPPSTKPRSARSGVVGGWLELAMAMTPRINPVRAPTIPSRIGRGRSGATSVSNCLESQAGISAAARSGDQGCRVRMMVLRMVSSFRMQATSASFLGLPVASSR